MLEDLRAALAANDVTAAAIALAEDDNPYLDRGELRRTLDALAVRLRPSLDAGPPARRLDRLIDALCLELGFHTPDVYGDARLDLLDHVLETRAGSPVALSVVAIALGERLGVALSGVAFPGHFMLRHEASEPIFIDPSSGVYPFPEESLRGLIVDELRVTPERAQGILEPASAKTVATRLLRNLSRAYEERGDLGRAMLATDRLFEVTGSVMARCERGLHAAALGATHGALDDLEAYLRRHADRAVSMAAARLRPSPVGLN